MDHPSCRRAAVAAGRLGSASALFVLVFSATLLAQDRPRGSGLDFLRIAPSPSTLALGEAGGASPSGPGAIYANPAVTAWDESVADLSYTFWISGVAHQHVGILSRRGSHAFTFNLYNSGSDDLQARDIPGPSQGDFSVGSMALSGSYAYRRGPVAAGLALHYLREEVFQYRADGYSLSMGLAGEWLDQRVRIGVSLQHLGDMDPLVVDRTLLPSHVRASLSALLTTFRIESGEDLELSISADVDLVQPVGHSSRKLFTQGFSADEPGQETPLLHAGLRISVNSALSLLTGVTLGETARPFSAGLEIDLEQLGFSYAIVPFETGYGTAHAIGIRIPF